MGMSALSCFLFHIHRTCSGKVPCSKRYRSQEVQNYSCIAFWHSKSTCSSSSNSHRSFLDQRSININTNTGLASQFAYDIFNHNYIAKLHTDYLDSNPFKHAVVEKLFQDELLVKVKDECLRRLNFTQKETNIFKVCLFILKMHQENSSRLARLAPDRARRARLP